MATYSPHCASMAKRACSFVPTSDRLSANPRDSAPSSSNHLMDSVLDALLGLSDASDIAIDLSFGRLLDSRASDTEHIQIIHGALRIGSALVEAAKRSARKRASRHNSVIWALPPDLTTRVFSMLDGQSLCYAAAACSMFNKCAMDPLCYANIDLTTAVPKVNNGVVSTMIHRAGKLLQSLKLGIVPDSTLLSGPSQPMVYKDVAGFVWNDKRKRQGKESSTLTRNCLISLSGEGGAAGLLLRRLHLYNIEKLDNVALQMALSACPHLLDLEIIGLQVELRQTLMSVSSNCRLIERLSFESSKTGRDDSLKSPVCIDLVSNCPHLNSLALRGFKLQDYKARILVKGFRKLKYVDFSTSYSITGAFLRNIGGKTGSNLLEVLILRDCMHLKEVEVTWFLNEVLAGDFKLLGHIDISNREGLASEGDWYDRCYGSSIVPLKLVLEQRPHLHILAEFPKEGSFADIELMIDNDQSSEDSWASRLSSHTSDGSVFMSLSESSYNGDQGSGNEDGQDAGYAVYELSSDEVDFMLI